MKRVVIFILCIFAVSLLSGARLPFVLKSLTTEAAGRFFAENPLISPLVEIDGEQAVDVILYGDIEPEELPAEKERLHRFGNLTTLRLPLNKLAALEQVGSIERIYTSTRSQLLLDVSTSNQMNGSNFAGCDADYVQENLNSGEGVIVGVIDPYQLNWQHEDFMDENGSRVLAIWDQPGSGNPPELFGYGAEYTRQQLNDGNGPAINSTQHHGTQCAGIAAGDGSASDGQKAGMLPSAQIIYVRQASGSADLINAISYIAAKAQEIDSSKPVVISMSVGAMFGEPDGSDPVALALTSFGGVGRCSAVAAGNWYNYDCFATGAALYQEPVEDFNFTVTGSNTGGNDFVISRLYYQAGDDFNVSMVAPDGTSYGPVAPGEDADFNTPYGRIYLFHELTVLGNPYIELVVSDEYGTINAGDNWHIELEVPSEDLDDNGGWWWGWIAGVGYNADFENYYQEAYSLNTFACGAETVCVGAHDKSSGVLYSACSKGAPDGITKPEITAPTNANTPNASSATGYSSLCCTSGAAPHAAGAIGLILESDAELTPEAVMSRLTEQAFNDAQTGGIPNDRWGFGKLNAKGSRIEYGFGDVDNNGEIDAFDSSIILMYAAGINYFAGSDPLPWCDWRALWADVDGNGDIEAYDASLILQYVVEIISSFPVQ